MLMSVVVCVLSALKSVVDSVDYISWGCAYVHSSSSPLSTLHSLSKRLFWFLFFFFFLFFLFFFVFFFFFFFLLFFSFRFLLYFSLS